MQMQESSREAEDETYWARAWSRAPWEESLACVDAPSGHTAPDLAVAAVESAKPPNDRKPTRLHRKTKLTKMATVAGEGRSKACARITTWEDVGIVEALP